MSKSFLLENRVITLPNGKQINPQSLESQVEKICHYVKYVFVGTDISGAPFALIIPNKKLYSEPDYEKTPELGCFCPRNLDEIGRCLSGCLRHEEFEDKPNLGSAVIINADIPEGLSRDEVFSKYRNIIEEKFDINLPQGDDFYWVNLK